MISALNLNPPKFVFTITQKFDLSDTNKPIKFGLTFKFAGVNTKEMHYDDN